MGLGQRHAGGREKVLHDQADMVHSRARAASSADDQFIAMIRDAASPRGEGGKTPSR
jgi:hypothetical protein